MYELYWTIHLLDKYACEGVNFHVFNRPDKYITFACLKDDRICTIEIKLFTRVIDICEVCFINSNV
jgi:hypothetical protein